MNRPQTFRELDDLVLDLKGLVLVRDIRRRASADDEELALYGREIERVRNRLADLMKNGGTAGRRPSRTRARPPLGAAPPAFRNQRRDNSR